MTNIKIFDAEYRFMNIIWKNGSIKSQELVRIANEELGWKKSTTYTVIRRLCERGAITNDNSVVSPLVNKEQIMIAKTEQHIGNVYDGSLKLFFATFLQKEKLTNDEITELRRIIDDQSRDGV
ncbi:MAG: BlaI/MecI/CopY family transcriptional regulator [Clostridia bacterium]|nr:BlaI/MecI/CopY family transcriptional regulator [Clostridia bacterium]